MPDGFQSGSTIGRYGYRTSQGVLAKLEETVSAAYEYDSAERPLILRLDCLDDGRDLGCVGDSWTSEG